jgi:hypothetical protein
MTMAQFMALARRVAWLLCFVLVAAPCGAQRKEEPRNPPLAPAESLREGRALVADLLARKPAENSTNTGTVRVRDSSGATVVTGVVFEVYSTPTNWVSVYETRPLASPTLIEKLTVTHCGQEPNQYRITRPAAGVDTAPTTLSGAQLMVPFAGSDFWVADLGLEFLHWPDPRLLRKEMRHSRPANVLEVRNPSPASGGYARILAWVDTDNGGILHADAYDTKGEKIKEFDPTGVRNRELEEMEMRNRRSNSHTWIKFDLAP